MILAILAAQVEWGPVVSIGYGDPYHWNWNEERQEAAGLMAHWNVAPRLDLVGEIDVVFTQPLGKGSDFLMAGVFFGACWTPEPSWIPHLTLAVGGAWTDNDNPPAAFEPLSTHLNFGLHAGVGYFFQINENVRMLLEVRFWHYSNADAKYENRGLNTMLIATGFLLR